MQRFGSDLDIQFFDFSSDVGGEVATVCRTPLLEREVTINRRMKQVLKPTATKIATAVGRNKTSVYKALSPESLSSKDVRLLERALKAMIQKSAGQLEVTLAMLMKRCKISAVDEVPHPTPPRPTPPRPAPPSPTPPRSAPLRPPPPRLALLAPHGFLMDI